MLSNMEVLKGEVTEINILVSFYRVKDNLPFYTENILFRKTYLYSEKPLSVFQC